MSKSAFIATIVTVALAQLPSVALADAGSGPPQVEASTVAKSPGPASPAATVDGQNEYGCWSLAAAKNRQLPQEDPMSTSFCLVGGAFAIPFRAELSGKKDVLGGISGDLFAGVNVTLWNGFSITPLAYFGYLPTLNVTNASNGTSTNSTGGALDVGLGIAVPLKNVSDDTDIHFGVVAGADVTGGSNKFAYNGKPYFSAFLGLNF